MAEKIIGLRINVVGTDDIVKRIGSLNAELEQTKQQATQLQAALKKAVSSNNTADAAKYGKELADARAKQNDLKLASTALNKELKLQQKAFKATAAEGADSYNALDAQLSILRNRFKQLSAAERDSDIGKQLTAQIDDLNGQLVESDAKLGVFSRNVGNYSDSVVKALRRAANEEGLIKDINTLNSETDDLRARFKKLYDGINAGDKSVDASNSIKELAQIEKQIKINQSALKGLNGQLANTKGLESQKSVSGRDIRNIGKAGGKGLGGAAGVAGGLFQGAEAAAQFGPVGVAAFGIFAAGGLAFKGIQALDELTKQFQKLESQTAAFSGVSGSALKTLSVDVKATADTFGKDQEEILKTTKALSKSLGVDFATALDLVGKGLLTGADASGELLATLEGSAEAARVAGLSIDDLIVFSNEATKSGLLSDRGIELVNTFGTAIKTNSGEAKAALNDALGAEFTDKIFKGVQDGSISTKDAIKQVSEELTKQGVSADAASKVFVDAFGAGTAAENEFILSLKGIGAGIDSYIDKSNGVTRVQQEQLKANKALASAQQGLANSFEDLGFSFSATFTKIQAGLINFANKTLIAFNSVFGNGLAAGRESLRKTTQALSDQSKIVADLEKNVTPLLKRYDELTALLPTLAVGSDEAVAAQAELAKVIQAVGDNIPTAISQFGKYNQVLAVNAGAAKDYIAQQKLLQKSIEDAQSNEAIKQLQKVEYLSPINAVVTGVQKLNGTQVSIDDAEVVAITGELNKLGKEAQDLNAILKTTEAGRQKLASSLAIQGASVSDFQDPSALAARQKAIFEQLSKEADDAANAGNKKQADIAKTAGEAELSRQKAEGRAKAAEAAKAAAEKAKAERDALIEEEKATREQLQSAKEDTEKAITSLSLQGIKDRGAREAETLKLTFADRIESETKALSDAADARIASLGKLAKSAASDAAIRSQFGTPEQIAAQAETVAQETADQIRVQTSLIISERDKQLKELEVSRAAAISEAIKSIDSDALNNAIGEVQSRLSLATGASDAIQLRIEVAQDDIDFAAKKATAALGLARAANLVTEKEYQTQIKAIEQNSANARIALLTNNYEEQSSIIFAKTELQKLQIEGNLEQQQQAIRDARDASVTQLETNLEEQLISTETFDAALIELNASTNAQLLLANKVAAQDIAAVEASTSKERIDLEREITSAQIDSLAERAAAYRENQQATLKEFATAVSGVGSFILNAAKTADDFFIASENNKKAAIDARYAAELNGARGNASAIAAIEARKAAEIEKIERAAATRRKAIAIAQAIVNGAVAVTNILATTPDPTGIFTAIRIGAAVATTVAQVALISSQQFALGGSIPAGSGFITGRSHAGGGVHGAINGRAIEAEGGEYKTDDEYGNGIIINKRSSSLFRNTLKSIGGKTFAGKRQLLSNINAYGGLGVRFAAGGSIPPQSIGTGISGGAQVAQAQTAAILQLANEAKNIAIATGERIDRMVVVADAQAIVAQGLKDTPRRNTQIL
jgi:hypothetical protein